MTEKKKTPLKPEWMLALFTVVLLFGSLIVFQITGLG